MGLGRSEFESSAGRLATVVRYLLLCILDLFQPARSPPALLRSVSTPIRLLLLPGE